MKEMNIAHEAVLLNSNDDMGAELSDNGSLPLMIDGNDIIEGSEATIEHLEKVKDFKEQWVYDLVEDKFQSDACYCSDDEGEIE